MICEYLDANQNFGMRIEISREEELLDTGGGLKQAAWFFLEGGESADEPFLLHNVDVLSNIDLGRMMQRHREETALATLAVQQRETSRYLLFDEHGQLCGRRAGREARDEMARSASVVQPLAFSGIHVISPRLLTEMRKEGTFSIIDAYLRLPHKERKIAAFRADDYYWRDLGRPEHIAEAAAMWPAEHTAKDDLKYPRLSADIPFVIEIRKSTDEFLAKPISQLSSSGLSKPISVVSLAVQDSVHRWKFEPSSGRSIVEIAINFSLDQ